MTDIIVYEFANSDPKQAVPGLLKKCLEQQWKVVIQCASEEVRDELNYLLWTFDKESFLPHGTESDGYSEKQPVYLTCKNENPNGSKAKLLFGTVVASEVESISEFDRYMIFISGNDQNLVTASNEFCTQLVKSGHQAKYRQQNSKGGWNERVIE